MKITIAGNLIVDKIKHVDCYPQPTMLCNITAVEQGVGGCAANTSAALKTLWPQAQVCAAGLTGADEDGSWLCGRLAGFGVDTAHVAQTSAAPTSFTDVFTEAGSGRRTFFHARGANALFGRRQALRAARGSDLFHVGYALLLDALDAPNEEYGTEMAALLAGVAEQGAQTSLDLVSEDSGRFGAVVRPSLPWCDHLIINETEAGKLAGLAVRTPEGALSAQGLRAACRALLEGGVRRTVVVHAPEAACLMDRAGAFALVPSLALSKGYIQGSVGAGDAFCAAALAGLAQGADAALVLRAASCAAACNLSRANSTDGLRPMDEAMALEARFPRMPAPQN